MGKLKKKDIIVPVKTIETILDEISDIEIAPEQREKILEYKEVYLQKYQEGGIDAIRSLVLKGKKNFEMMKIKNHLEKASRGEVVLDKDLRDRAEGAFSASLMLKLQTLIENIDETKMSDANLKDLTNSLGTIFDRYRVSQDKSTQNVSVSTISGLVGKITDKKVIDVEVKVVDDEAKDL